MNKTIEFKCSTCETIFPVKITKYLDGSRQPIAHTLTHWAIICPSCFDKLPEELTDRLREFLTAKKDSQSKWEVGINFLPSLK